MSSERWERVKELCIAALERAETERESFLGEACREDESLRREVESTLSYQDKAENFLESPPLELGAKLLIELQNEVDRTTEGYSDAFIGKCVSKYRILEKLGSGGMGVVFKAEDTILGRFVALKFLPEFVAPFDRLQREARAASALDHPNICTVYEVDQYDGIPFIAMQYLSGHTLKEEINNQPLPNDRMVEIAIQTAEGLEAAHAVGIIHRDVKSVNIFVTQRLQTKILDFGLAKLTQRQQFPDNDNEGLSAPDHSAITSRKPNLESSHAGRGTVAYMSPEQISGEEVDERSDLFSFGVCLYEMATGQLPFMGETTSEIFDHIVADAPVPPSELNPNLPSALEKIISRSMSKVCDSRYQTAAEMRDDLQRLKRAMDVDSNIPHARWALLVVLILLAALGAGYFYMRKPQPRQLTEQDTIVLADFKNTTGDAVLDDTLKQALAVQLGQSPFLNVLSDQKVRDTLKLMGRSPAERLSPEVARDLCQRVESKAYLSGSVASLGTQYVIALNLVNCQTGDSLAQEQVTARGKEQILKALDQAATNLRGKVGESLSTIQKFDVPIEQATTSSLDALKSYSLGMKVREENGDFEAIPFFHRAIERDPNFASAYTSLASSYSRMGEGELASECVRKAYELRDRASEREKLRISTFYFFLIGEAERETESTQLWAREYPRDRLAHLDLAHSYRQTGQYESAIAEDLEALRLDPNYALAHYDLVSNYVYLNRLNEAKAAYQQALARSPDFTDLQLIRYRIAFLENDTGQMERLLAWAIGKPGIEDSILASVAETEAFHGHLGKARELVQRAIESARRNGKKGMATWYGVDSAWSEVDYGYPEHARHFASAALAEKSNRDLQTEAAMILARAGDSYRAQAVADDLARRFPLDTLAVNMYWLPAIGAAIELNRHNPARAIDILNATTPFEFYPPGGLYTVYLRGLAYLSQHRGREAATEFQKLLDHRGIAGISTQGALAHLGLARAYALQAQSASGSDADAMRGKARAAYQDFLTLWKDADRDIPILRQAQAEYRMIARAH
jgi:eukaryotic-like serine/threonine-protein kinase